MEPLMLEIRWHSRAGQGAVTGNQGLVHCCRIQKRSSSRCLHFMVQLKRGASMTAYNRIDDNVILNHEKYMSPDFVFILDPGLALTDDITANGKDTTKYIITTILERRINFIGFQKLQDQKIEFFVLDCFKIAERNNWKSYSKYSNAWCIYESGMFEN